MHSRHEDFKIKPQFIIKNEDTLLCYFPKGDVDFNNNKPRLIIRKNQIANNCWFEGSMMFANLLMKDLRTIKS